MRFRYVAYLPERGVFKDTIEALDQNEAAAAAASLGYRLLEIAPVREAPGLETLFPSMLKASTRDLARFFHPVASMLASGGNRRRPLEVGRRAAGRRRHVERDVGARPAGGRLGRWQRGEGTGRVEGAGLAAPVYRRLDLPEGAVIPGPAILEQPDATVFIDPGLAGRIDRHGNLIIAREGAHATD